ncbi:hypothetical protein OROHE_008090 [Orobanche hederae]
MASSPNLRRSLNSVADHHADVESSAAAAENQVVWKRMALCKKVRGRGRGKGKEKWRARDGDDSVDVLAGERIVRQRTSGPVISDLLYLTTGREPSTESHEPVHTDLQRQSSPIKAICRHIDETESVLGIGRSLLLTETRVDGASSPTDQTRGFLIPDGASIPVEHTSSLDHHADGASVPVERTQSLDHHADGALVPIITLPIIPDEMLVTPPEIAPMTQPSSSTADLIPIPLEYSSIAIRADMYHSSRLQYISYRPHSPFSTTIARERKDLDEEAYSRWLDSGDRDGSKLIDAEHLDAYMRILQFDPGFVGMRWLDDWAAQMVLVHTSFLERRFIEIDDEDLDFLLSHVHGLRPFWGDHRPWWELCVDHLEYIFRVLVRTLGCCIIIIHDSLVQEHDAYGKLRSRQASGISRLIPTILQRSEFYKRRPDITPINQFRVATARKDLCYVQDDSTYCGAFSIWTLESLVPQSFSRGKTEADIYAFRGRLVRSIWMFIDDVDTVTYLQNHYQKKDFWS